MHTQGSQGTQSNLRARKTGNSPVSPKETGAVAVCVSRPGPDRHMDADHTHGCQGTQASVVLVLRTLLNTGMLLQEPGLTSSDMQIKLMAVRAHRHHEYLCCASCLNTGMLIAGTRTHFF
jgi:hypothetical protein